jgi:hypothetical protein
MLMPRSQKAIEKGDAVRGAAKITSIRRGQVAHEVNTCFRPPPGAPSFWLWGDEQVAAL